MTIFDRMSKAIGALTGPATLVEKSISGSDIEFATRLGRRTVKWSEYRADEAIEHAYQKSYYLNTCVDAIVEATAAVPLKVFERSGENTWEPAPDNGLQYLFDFPNPHFTRRMLIERVSGHLLLAGNGLWSKVRDGSGTIIELWPLNPDHIEVIPGRGGEFISHYMYGKGRAKRRLEKDDVVHFSRTNYQTLYWGAGQIQIGQRLIDFDSSSLDWNKVAIQNAGVIPGILGVKSKITDKQLKDLRQKMREKRLGMDEAGEDLIIGSDVDYHRIGSNPHEMDWIESRKLTRQDIAMFMRVPLPMVSIYDDATLANIEQARKIFYLDRVIPFLLNIEDGINLAITPEYGDPSELKVEFDYSNIAAIQDNHFEKARTANVLVRIGFHPRAVNRRLSMGYNDNEIVDDFLVTPELEETITSVGTASGTRSEQPVFRRRRQVQEGEEATKQNLVQWHGIIKGKINNELMRERYDVVDHTRQGDAIDYLEEYLPKWQALYLAAGESLSKYYIAPLNEQEVHLLAYDHATFRSHLLQDLLDREDANRGDARAKLIEWLYTTFTNEHSGEMADGIIKVATNA